MLLPIAMLLAANAPADPAAQRLAVATALYDELCLRAFPDDAALDAAMVARGAVPLTAEQVKVTLRDDPGRGWRIGDGGGEMLVFLELPPFHACSVRWPMPSGEADLTDYRARIAAWKPADAGFAAMAPMDQNMGDIHIHAVGEQRRTAEGGAEALYVIRQDVTDPQRRAKGETGSMLRFVHQIVAGR